MEWEPWISAGAGCDGEKVRIVVEKPTLTELKFVTLEEVSTWAAWFMGETSGFQRAQNGEMLRAQADLTKFETRLGSLERKVVWASGFAAAAGAMGGVVLKSIVS